MRASIWPFQFGLARDIRLPEAKTTGALLADRPLSQRRAALESLPAKAPKTLRISPLLQAPAGQVLEAVRHLGLEGVVGKQIDSIYEPGERSGAWIKLRANME